MLECFARLTPAWLKRATVYTGSVGPFQQDFRFRLQQDKGEGLIHAAVYTKVCYELAEDKEEKSFPWNEEGIAELRQWLQERYDAFAGREEQA